MRVTDGCQTRCGSAACVEPEWLPALPLCYSNHGTSHRSSALRETIIKKKDLTSHIIVLLLEMGLFDRGLLLAPHIPEIIMHLICLHAYYTSLLIVYIIIS